MWYQDVLGEESGVEPRQGEGGGGQQGVLVRTHPLAAATLNSQAVLHTYSVRSQEIWPYFPFQFL